MSKHTIGPWKVFPTSSHQAILTASGVPVATVPFTDKEGKANAKIIAAAPEMLGALKLVLLGLDRGSISSQPTMAIEGDTTDVILVSLASIIRATIQQAEEDQS